MRVELADLGSAGVLLAEYDPGGDVARIDVRALARVRERLGEAGAARFLAYAVAHERFHREHPGDSEAAAHAAAQARTGDERRLFERVARA